jgi:hypothetical protein
VIPLLLALALLAAPAPPPPAHDGPPDLGRFAVWAGSERVHLDLPGLGIPPGLYGPAQARALLASASGPSGPRVTGFEEVPLPNIPGRLRLFLVHTRPPSGGADTLLFAYFSRQGTGPSPGTGPFRLNGWTLVRLIESGRP